MGETSKVDCDSVGAVPNRTRCAASATFRPTPPREVVILPGLVEFFPRAKPLFEACDVMSTAAEPITISLAVVLSLVNDCTDEEIQIVSWDLPEQVLGH